MNGYSFEVPYLSYVRGTFRTMMNAWNPIAVQPTKSHFLKKIRSEIKAAFLVLLLLLHVPYSSGAAHLLAKIFAKPTLLGIKGYKSFYTFSYANTDI